MDSNKNVSRAVELLDPYTFEVQFRIPYEYIRRALLRVWRLTEEEELNIALTLAWGLAKNEMDRRAVSIVHAIVSFTKDGLIRPEDFDVYSEYAFLVSKNSRGETKP